jgi:hypothetical protein
MIWNRKITNISKCNKKDKLQDQDIKLIYNRKVEIV